MEHGWIYVLVNSSIPGMAKVGRTSRLPLDRAAELSAATGVATPFVIAFDHHFADCCEAERSIHTELDQRKLRIAPNREFFRGPISEIIRVVIDAADQFGTAPMAGPDLSADLLRQAGDRSLFGQEGALQDVEDALRCYKLAASRGSLIAFERLGQFYVRLYLTIRDKAARRRALAALKEGARQGNYYCYCELAILFAAERHVTNFEKAWDMFFARRSEASGADIEENTQRFAQACILYITYALDLDIPKTHLAELEGASGAILRTLLDQLVLVRESPQARFRAVQSLRWTYESLLPPPVPFRSRPARRLCWPWVVRADPEPAWRAC